MYIISTLYSIQRDARICKFVSGYVNITRDTPIMRPLPIGRSLYNVRAKRVILPVA